MQRQVKQRVAALFEVLGVYIAGAYLNDLLSNFVIEHKWTSDVSPFALLTTHATNADLLIASRQMLLLLAMIYASYFAIIVPLNWWHRRTGRREYGLTRANHSWRFLIYAAIATSALTQWPVLVHTLVDAVHPLGRMAPWRQAFFDMSWLRWQFWLFAGIMSYAVIPVVEELLFRGYYQRRLAEDWGDGPAIIGTACLFTFAHKQYLIANAYNVTMVISLLCMAIGLGIVFAYTRSLFASMLAHAIINVPMTTVWQGALRAVFFVIALRAWKPAVAAIRKVFTNASALACVFLAVLEAAYVLGSSLSGIRFIAFAMLVIAILLEIPDRRRAHPRSAAAHA